MLQKSIFSVVKRGPGHFEGSSGEGPAGVGAFMVPPPGDSEAGRNCAIFNKKNFWCIEEKCSMYV